MSFGKEILDKLAKPNHNLINIMVGVPCERALALVNYYPSYKELNDRLSTWIIKVKNNDKSMGLSFGFYASKMIGDSFTYDCVLRALKHSETIATGEFNAVDYFAAPLILAHSANYRRDVLQKRRPCEKFVRLKRQQRQEALKDNYFCKEITFKNILVVDDITTSGVTLGAIYNAIVQSNPTAKVSFLVIGRTIGREDGPVKQVNFNYDLFQSCNILSEIHLNAAKDFLVAECEL